MHKASIDVQVIIRWSRVILRWRNMVEIQLVRKLENEATLYT